MITDPETLRAAQALVTRYGAGAPVAAAQRAEELRAEGDRDGAAYWKSIESAAEELLRVAPNEGERVN